MLCSVTYIKYWFGYKFIVLNPSQVAAKARRTVLIVSIQYKQAYTFVYTELMQNILLLSR